MSKSKTKATKKRRSPVIFLLSIGVLVMLVLATYKSYNNMVFPNISVAGVSLGGKSHDEALTKLKKNLTVPENVTFSVNNKEFTLQTSEIAMNIDYEKSVTRAINYASSGNLPRDIIQRVSLITNPIDLPLFLSYEQNKLTESLSIISSEVEIPPVYPSIGEKNGVINIDKGKNGLTLNKNEVAQKLLNKVARNEQVEITINLEPVAVELSDIQVDIVLQRATKLLQKEINLTFENTSNVIPKAELLNFLDYGSDFDRVKIEQYVEKLANKINRPSQNSVFKVENGVVLEFIPSIDGVVIKDKELVQGIYDALIKMELNGIDILEITIPVVLNPATIKNEDVNNLGINILLGHGVSYFKGSIPNRVYNVNLAASKFNGILVAPGETFSFNQILGDVSSLTGYKSAYVIKDGKTVLGDGGGVCQVSTTLFRAVLSAGLPITQRRAHSYRVGYYEQGFPVGLDATVYAPTTDFKFINDTPAHLLVQSEIDIPSSTLVFEIYGTSDGRIAKTTKPVITSSSAPPEDLYVDDPSLPLGKVQQIEHKAWGARVVFDYTVTRNGEVLIDKTFVSNYRPWQAVFLRGTKPQ